MTQTFFAGPGMIWPTQLAALNTQVGFGAAGTIDASAEKFAMTGRVWWADRSDTSKDISSVSIRIGAVSSFNASSQWRVSLQDVSLTAGPPIQPDGTVDQSFVSAAGAGPTANSWNTVTLSANRTVSFGDLFSVVVDYSAFTSTSSIIIQGLNTAATGFRQHQTDCVLFTASWASQAFVPVVVFGFSDGTYGTFMAAGVCNVYNTRAFNSGSTSSGSLSTGDERGNEWVQDITMKAEGAWLDVNPAANADFDIVLYEGTTAIATVSVDANALQASASVRRSYFAFGGAPVTLTAGNTYRLMVKPTTANNVTIYTLTVNSSSYRDLLLQDDVLGNSRVDAGSFGAGINTEVAVMGLIICSVDNGAGGSGGSFSAGYLG